MHTSDSTDDLIAEVAKAADLCLKPLPLPKAKYDRWKKFIFEFDPSLESISG